MEIVLHPVQKYNLSQVREGRPFWISDFGGGKSRVVMLNLKSYSQPNDSYFALSRCYIDASIAPLIQALNDKGYVTRGCCSGLEQDHKKGVMGVGYIAFIGRCPLNIEGMRIEKRDNGDIFRVPLNKTEEERESFWQKTLSQILEIPTVEDKDDHGK